MSGAYGPTTDDEGVSAILTYLDAGGTLIDTGDFYGAGHNEMLIGRALRTRSHEDVVLSVKFGAVLSPDGAFIGFDGRPDAVRNSLAYSLRRLGTDYVDVYRPAGWTRKSRSRKLWARSPNSSRPDMSGRSV